MELRMKEHWNKLGEGCQSWLLLSLLYLAAHFMLFFLHGRWWDDWVLWGGIQRSYGMYMDAGGGYASYGLMYLVSLLPDGGYRWLAFFLYYASLLLLWRMLRRLASPQAAKWIAALVAVMPVNDARALAIDFPYTVCFFCFFLACFLLQQEVETSSLFRRALLRLTMILLFLYSFLTNSLLVFYAVPFAYVVWKKEKNTVYYLDLLLLPFVYWGVKQVFLQPAGAYAGYNAVTIGALVKAVVFTFPATLLILKEIVINLLDVVRAKPLVVLLIITIWSFVKHRNERADWQFGDLCGAVLGGCVLWLGLFPYIVVRHGPVIGTTGPAGRDTLLVSVGAAVLLYYVGRMAFSPWMQRCMMGCFLFLGVLHFNVWYLAYQNSWYQKVALMEYLETDARVEAANNILYHNQKGDPIDGSCFYALNGVGESVYHKQTIFFLPIPVLAPGENRH